MDNQKSAFIEIALAALLRTIHTESKEPDLIWEIASRLSAGGFRTPPRFEQSISIFDGLPGAAATEPHWLPLEELSLDAIEEYLQDKTVIRDLNPHLENLRVALTYAISDPDLERQLEKVLSAIRQYGWCVSSLPGVSLYDHARMTAALSVCLTQAAHIPADTLKQIEQGDTNPPLAVLIGGDLSGVQEFVYSITNKGPISALRGRSFFLQALTEALSRYVLDELHLPITNLIYSGGGSFYILARAGDEAHLQSIRAKISRILYTYHHGDLYLALGAEVVQARDFLSKTPQSSICARWGGLARALETAKKRRFSELNTDELRMVFHPLGNGGKQDNQCKTCGREFPQGAGVTIKMDGEEWRVCKSCKSYADLGEALCKVQYITLEKLPPSEANILLNEAIAYPYEEVLLALGLKIGVHEKYEQNNSHSIRAVWALTDLAYRQFDRNASAALIRRFLTNVAPCITNVEIDELREKGIADLPQANEDDPPIKPFSAIAAQSRGGKWLGILRMDLDNLGRVFSEGLGNNASLAHIASLSFAIDLYVEGWVGELARRRNQQHGELLYAIYSGGDDLTFIGAWDQVVELAIDVRRDLASYTGGHPAVKACGGIALIHNEYPLTKAATDADDALQKAKELEGKDALCFLGMPLPWVEFGMDDCMPGVGTVHQLMHLLEKENDHTIHRTILENYSRYADAQRQRENAGKAILVNGKRQTLFGPWNWRIYYSLREKIKKKPTLEAFAEHFHQNPASIEQIALAARWVDLKLPK